MSFGDLGAFEPIDGGAVNGHLAVGGLHAEERTFVSSVGCPVDDDFIALGDGVVDGEERTSDIGKCLAACLDVVFDVLDSRVHVGKHWIVVATTGFYRRANRYFPGKA